MPNDVKKWDDKHLGQKPESMNIHAFCVAFFSIGKFYQQFVDSTGRSKLTTPFCRSTFNIQKACRLMMFTMPLDVYSSLLYDIQPIFFNDIL